MFYCLMVLYLFSQKRDKMSGVAVKTRNKSMSDDQHLNYFFKKFLKTYLINKM